MAKNNNQKTRCIIIVRCGSTRLSTRSTSHNLQLNEDTAQYNCHNRISIFHSAPGSNLAFNILSPFSLYCHIQAIFVFLWTTSTQSFSSRYYATVRRETQESSCLTVRKCRHGRTIPNRSLPFVYLSLKYWDARWRSG